MNPNGIGDRRLAANRANARLSTGPRSAEGKAASSANALSHGLAVPLSADPAFASRIGALAAALAGPDAPPDRRAWALVLAEAEADLQRVRDLRTEWLGSVIDAGGGLDAAALAALLPRLVALERYERRARSRRRSALKAWPSWSDNEWLTVGSGGEGRRR